MRRLSQSVVATLNACTMKRIVILISGRGSNMQSIVHACGQDGWHAKVVAVISNKADAKGLQFAQEQGIATEVIDHRAHAQREAFDAALGDAIERHEPDAVLMAGFMRIVGPALVRRFVGRMLNIHPSLLPAFAGLNTHQRAIDAGCTVAGATVHFVSETLDSGPIVMQAVVPVFHNDSAELLAKRVLDKEHLIYPRAARWLTEGRLQVRGERVVQLDGHPQWLV
jgi:phosphoribosylglycinamide formyltransferase 1